MSPESVAPIGVGMPARKRWILVFSLMLAMFVSAIDQTVVATATPRILADLKGFELLSWVFTTYLLASTIVIPIVGKLSDIYGRRGFLLGGITVFMLASVACGAAQSMETLIAARGVQGLAGGVIFISVFTTIGDLFTPIERGKYIGLFTGTFALAAVLGPTVGGLITDAGGWRWVFYINVPFGLVALPAIWFNLPSRPALRRPRVDYAGAALLAAASIALLLAFEWAGDEYAWGSPEIAGLFGGSALLVGLFIAVELRHPEPVIPLGLFRNRTFVLCNVGALLQGGGLFATVQYVGLFAQTALGASATSSGLVTTPMSLGMVTASALTGQVLSRTGRYRVHTIAGATTLTLVMFILWRTIDADMAKWRMSATLVFMGLGFGAIMPTTTVLVQNSVPHALMGVSTSVTQYFRQVGSVMGVAIFAAVLTAGYTQDFDREIDGATRDSLLSAEASGAVAGGTLAQFDDPTLALNKRAFSTVSNQIRQLPDGEQLLAETRDAQRGAVAKGVQHIFFGGFLASIGMLITIMLLQETPLRSTFGPTAAAAPADGAIPREPV